VAEFAHAFGMIKETGSSDMDRASRMLAGAEVLARALTNQFYRGRRSPP
jgi:hypothetical protein